MPPASLSTLEVISPGPTTASSKVRRRRKARIFCCKFSPRVSRPSKLDLMVSQFIRCFRFPSYFLLPTSYVLLFHKARNHIVHGDRTDGAFFFVHYREHSQVVFVEQLEDVFFVGLSGNAEQRLASKFLHGLFRRGEQQPRHRNRA